MIDLTVKVQRLLGFDRDSNNANSMMKKEACSTSLHLAICIDNELDLFNHQDSIMLYIDGVDRCDNKNQMILSRSLLIKIFLEVDVDIDRQLKVIIIDFLDRSKIVTIIVTPLVLAVICDFSKVVSVLLDARAKWKADAHEDLQDKDLRNVIVLCSLERLLKKISQHERIIQRAIDVDDHQIMKNALEK